MEYQILQTGRRLWGQALPAGLFECFVLSEKTALDTARAPLLLHGDQSRVCCPCGFSEVVALRELFGKEPPLPSYQATDCLTANRAEL